MENKLEGLLNSLIEWGWKPMGYEAKFVKQQKNGKIHIYSSHGYYSGYRETLRTLTSKESGLWQFVCENGMVHLYTKHQIIIQEDDIITTYRPDYIFHDDEYYIIQSALTDESELEDFLLQNIKVDAND